MALGRWHWQPKLCQDSGTVGPVLAASAKTAIQHLKPLPKMSALALLMYDSDAGEDTGSCPGLNTPSCRSATLLDLARGALRETKRSTKSSELMQILRAQDAWPTFLVFLRIRLILVPSTGFRWASTRKPQQ